MKKIIISTCVALFLMTPVANTTAATADFQPNCFSDYFFAYDLAIALGQSHSYAQTAGFRAFDSCVAGIK